MQSEVKKEKVKGREITWRLLGKCREALTKPEMRD